MIDLALSIQDLWRAQRPFVVVTLVDIQGSAPQIVGAKAVVTAEGLFRGTVGGGKIENHCIRFAQAMIAEKSSAVLKSWNLQTDIKMSCGGAVTLFFEPHVPALWSIALFGAGHVAQELCRVLSTWSCTLRVFDTREEWLHRLPEAPHIIVKRVETLADEVASLPEGTLLLSMTQGHAVDLPVLKAALEAGEKFPFIGVIGSDVKGAKIRKELREAGVNGDRLVCPLGLPIGDNSPPEIAISVAAQLLAVRDELSFSISRGRASPAED